MWTIKDSNLSNADPRSWSELSLSTEPSMMPSFTPSRSLSTLPSLRTPSIIPSIVTSTMPSNKLSENGYCSVKDVIGKTLFVYGAGYCFKIVLDVGGQIVGDSNDLECSNKSGTGIPFSNYGGFTGNTLIWTQNTSSGFFGTMNFLEKTYLINPKLLINSFQAGKFDVTLELPTC